MADTSSADRVRTSCFLSSPILSLSFVLALVALPHQTAATQSARGQPYLNAVIGRLNAVPASSVAPAVDIKYWEFHDDRSEKLNNSGLVTLSDNVYDGREAIIASCTDPWGYRTGGEAGNRGDLLSRVRATNSQVVVTLAAASKIPIRGKGARV